MAKRFGLRLPKIKQLKLKLPKLPKFRFKLPHLPLSSPLSLTKRSGDSNSNKKRFKWSWKKFGVFAAYGAGILLLVLIFLFAWFAKDLPTPENIKSITQAGSTRLYDRDGNELYTISGAQKRILISSDQIPDSVKQATISLEDKTFYTNPGIDLKGIARSVFVDLVSGSKAQGGSTITQQYVRLAILNDTDKNYVRKIKEIILAIELDTLYNKDQILTMYLNTIPYGGSKYGIEAASESFYGKKAKDLTLSQAATLAALPQAPSTLSPYGPNTDRLLARRDEALNSMVSLNYITQDEATSAKKDPLGVVPESNSVTAPHFVQYVQKWLVEYFTQQLGNAQLAEQKVEAGGLSVTTTLDLSKQQIAEQAVSDNVKTTLKRSGANDAGLVTTDPKTGEILAMVGSTDYNNTVFGAFNAATATHQPGSSFKPIVYATGFKGSLNPSSVLFDLKTDFGGGYTPNNYDGKFHGPVTIRQALGNSFNIPAVKVAGIVGVNNVIKTAEDLGITSLDDSKNDYGLSIALGSADVSPLEMAGAYGAFANNGILVPTTPVLKIVDSSSKTIYDHTTPEARAGKQVLDPQIAYEISSILSDTNAKKPEFANVMSYLTLANRPVASKTGTTDSYRDAWTVGYTPDLVTSVWVGNNDHSPMTNYSIGAIAAAPIWHQAMLNYEKNQPVNNFVQPTGIQTVTVDKLSNKLPGQGSEPITDIFASWQVPTKQDNVHQQVKVCTENGLLADSSIPESLTTLKTFTYIQSEMPNNANWEGPVRAWAIANNYNSPPPTQKCSVDQSSQPSINITSPADSSNVTGVFNITASASSPSGIKSVEFFIDGTSIGNVTSSPYQTSYNSTSLSEGSHTILATVTSTSGATNSDQIVIAVPTTTKVPPNDPSNFKGTTGGSGKINLTWNNPNASDLASTYIYVYNDTTGVLISTVKVDHPAQSTTVSGLTPGPTRFIAKEVDTSGNQSSGVKIVLTVI